MEINQEKAYRTAWLLSLFTIAYNLVEGMVSVGFGYTDETLTLFGFGVDSFIEVMSGLGVAFMVMRIRKNPESEKSTFEIRALRTTGWSFYLLSLGLLVGLVVSMVDHHAPQTTFPGIVISVLSILIMWWLMRAKRAVGIQLNSNPIIADASCTRVCMYMSLVLLVSSFIYELTGFAYADTIGTLGLIWFSVAEGREAFEKARGKSCGCSDHCCSK